MLMSRFRFGRSRENDDWASLRVFGNYPCAVRLVKFHVNPEHAIGVMPKILPNLLVVDWIAVAIIVMRYGTPGKSLTCCSLERRFEYLP